MSMSMSLLLSLRRLRPSCLHLPPSLSLSLYCYILAPPHCLPFSSTATQPFAARYLIQSCGLPPDKALRASKYIPHLKSPDKPDAVLRFLRQTGISQSDITTAVARHPRILCSHLDNIWRPNVAKLQELGLSTQDISRIISRSPGVFTFNFVPKIDFWMGALGSIHNLSVVLKKNALLLRYSLEKVAMPNLSFLRDQCGLSVPQIVRLIRSNPRVIVSSPEALQINAKRAQELGVTCPSPMFLYALVIVGSLSQCLIDARLNNLQNLGLSKEQVTTLVSRLPLVLFIRKEMMAHKIEFFTKEVGSFQLCLIHPAMLTYSLEKRLIPRNLVRKLLELKGLPVANLKFTTFAKVNEKVFVEKFVMPYEDAIPGLHQAYVDACAGKVAVLKSLGHWSFSR